MTRVFSSQVPKGERAGSSGTTFFSDPAHAVSRGAQGLSVARAFSSVFSSPFLGRGCASKFFSRRVNRRFPERVVLRRHPPLRRGGTEKSRCNAETKAERLTVGKAQEGKGGAAMRGKARTAVPAMLIVVILGVALAAPAAQSSGPDRTAQIAKKCAKKHQGKKKHRKKCKKAVPQTTVTPPAVTDPDCENDSFEP